MAGPLLWPVRYGKDRVALARHGCLDLRKMQIVTDSRSDAQFFNSCYSQTIACFKHFIFVSKAKGVNLEIKDGNLSRGPSQTKRVRGLRQAAKITAKPASDAVYQNLLRVDDSASGSATSAIESN